MSAPAGFGKTTMLADWLGTGPAGGRLIAWLSLDPSDNDPVLFWAYFIAALRTAVPGVGQGALALLSSTESPTEAFVVTLLNDLAALSDQVVVVLDDYHVIEEPHIRDGMIYLVEHLPPPIRLVIASRADPALPLARLRARGELVEIRANDLRFTLDEAASYLHEVMGLELTSGDVAALEGRTEGWIAALQLAALSMQGRADVAGFIAGFAGDDRYIVDYLVGEVLQRQPEHVRSFLLHTSILSRLNGSLCDAVTGQHDGRAMLEALDRANLFLVPLDDRRLWYRYHHLFADVLRARLLDEQPDQVRDLHRRASDWYARNGDQSAAIGHALDGEDFERAADLIEMAAMPAFRARQEATFRRWLEALPDELFRVRPVLAIAVVAAHMVRGDIEGVEERLQDIEHCLEAAGGLPRTRTSRRGRWSSSTTNCSGGSPTRSPSTGPESRCCAATPPAPSPCPPGARARRRRRSPRAGLGGRTARPGALDPRRSRRRPPPVHRSAPEPAKGGEPVRRSRSVPCLGGHSDRAGPPWRGDGHLRARTEGCGRAGAARVAGRADMHVGMSELLRERNDLDAAQQHLQTSSELGEHAGLPQNAYRSRVALARIRQAQGDLAGAENLLDEAERV